jgi:hypothetical protein
MTVPNATVEHHTERAGSDVAGRVAAVAAALFGVCLFVTVAAVDVPSDVTDAELVRWWKESANRMAGVYSGFAAIGAATALAVVRHRLGSLPRGQHSAWMAFGRNMATVVSGLWLVTGAIRGAVGHLVDVMGEPLPGPDVLRMVTAMNYVLLGTSGMAALGLTILGVSVAVLRDAVLGRWVGWVGSFCACAILLAVVARYGAYATPLAIVWALCLAVALWRAPTQVR